MSKNYDCHVKNKLHRTKAEAGKLEAQMTDSCQT